MKLKIALLLLSVMITTACISFYVSEKVQVLPTYDFENISEIEIHDIISDRRMRISETSEIQNFSRFFKDSTNYFTNDELEMNQADRIYSIQLVSPDNNFTFDLYYDNQSDRVELGYFEERRTGDNEYSLKKYNRFYMDKSLIRLIERNYK